MRLVSTLTGVSLTGMMLALSAPASAAVDAKLLEMLRANGSINQAQYNELQGDLAKETKEKADQKAQSERMSSFEQKVAWAAKTQIKGDVRLRYEDVNVDDPNSSSGNQDRQRVRAVSASTARSTRRLTLGFVSPLAAALTDVRPTRASTTTSTRSRCGSTWPTSTGTRLQSLTCT